MKRALAIFLLFACAGCGQKMSDRGRIKPFEPSAVFADGSSARPVAPDTVPRVSTSSATNESLRIPLLVTSELLHRGQKQFNIYCSVCHGRDGYGDGIVVRHGFTPPPSFHTPRLRGVA